ncbi:hypothetical protein [Streptomyces sp. S186]|uniref:hypothetical protein n=1 Tax=Streptomyces sp. S186 TaxID=3434395 RepID=UPI003F66D87F
MVRDPGGLVEPDFAQEKGAYRFHAVLALVSEIVLVFLAELVLVLGVVLRRDAARSAAATDGPGPADEG